MFRNILKFKKNKSEPIDEPLAGIGQQVDVKAVETLPKQSAVTSGEVLLFLFIVSLSASYLFMSSLSSRAKDEKEHALRAAVINVEPIPHTIVDPYQGILLQARAAYVLDVKNNKSLFSKDENTALPLASLTKIMTVQMANELLPKDSVVKIKEDALASEGDSGLYLGEEWNLPDIIDLTLVSSSNDGAYAIASSANSQFNQGQDKDTRLSYFIQSMNAKAFELGFSGMYFNNVTGLDENQYEAGGYGSAREVAELFSYVILNNSELLEATKYGALTVSSLGGRMHSVKNTSSAMNAIPSIIGSKTGYTNLAQGNLVIAFDAGINYPIVIAVLGSTFDGRFNDVIQLSEATLRYLENQQ